MGGSWPTKATYMRPVKSTYHVIWTYKAVVITPPIVKQFLNDTVMTPITGLADILSHNGSLLVGGAEWTTYFQVAASCSGR